MEGAEVERRSREPSRAPKTRAEALKARGAWEGGVPSPENFLIFDLKIEILETRSMSTAPFSMKNRAVR